MALFNSPFAGIGDALRGLNPFGGLLGGTGGGAAPAPAPKAPPIAEKVIQQIFQPQGSAETGTPASAAPQVSAAKPAGNMQAYRDAIASIESRGQKDPYRALGPATKGDRAYGKYQVMGANIPSWTKEALGRSMTPQEFLRDNAAQDAVFDHKFGQSIQRYGSPEDAASVWFTGRPRGAASGAARDVTGTSGNKYVSMFSNALGKGGGASPAPADNWAGLRPGEQSAAPEEANSGRPGPYQRKRSASAGPEGVGPDLPQTPPPEGRDPVDFALGAIRKAKSTRALRSLGPAATISVLQQLGRESRAAKVGGNGSA